ncbi:hypothetical protein EYB25_008890 [Talaromyces marneffei]|uniref:Phosphoglycerate mutase, putative n=1 Tax=Talaromyces marneffei (strain ATCC 18224 / CBS 334.59 / QM 7333) TaxID=441960 RepID=B6QUZ8_TALMQ|nr:phosphoglycerate mutase, putative [Talaromyces marneffei ATCC 18224]KAE8548512.1 hypothetical protein EYB25_008890 [Talaromyces marneffei]
MSNLDSMTPRVFLARHGTGKLIDPTRIARIWVSPRKRAQQTFRLLFDVDGRDDYGNLVEVSEDIAEWDYGDYEGLRVGEVRSSRKERGLDRDQDWNIWRHGYEGGESAQQVTERLDRLISKIRDLQRPFMDGSEPADVVLAHSRCSRFSQPKL